MIKRMIKQARQLNELGRVEPQIWCLVFYPQGEVSPSVPARPALRPAYRSPVGQRVVLVPRQLPARPDNPSERPALG
jgi:hypothetical protein